MSDYPTITREQAASLDDRAEFPHLVPQWETAEGVKRYAVLRALSGDQRWAAEKAATTRREAAKRGDPPEWWVDPYKLMIEIIRRGVVSPPDLPFAVVSGWNHDVQIALYYQIEALGGFVAARIARELALIASEPAPAVPDARPGEPDNDPDGVGADTGETAPGGDGGEPDGDGDG
jgi:hypothetical protein